MATKIEVKEQTRRIVSRDGATVILHNVTALDNSGSWLRLWSDEGYVLVNPNNVLTMIIKGEVVL